MARALGTELVRLLHRQSAPLYVINDVGEIVFVNDAVAAWTGWHAAALVGQTVRYHSNVDVTGAAAVAAALCPPPDVFFGKECRAAVSLPGSDGQLALRQVRFVPLSAGPSGVQGVLALVAAEPSPPDAAPIEPDDARLLHERLKRYRQAQRRRYAMEMMLGDSPAMQRVRAQVAAASRSDCNVLILGPPGSGRQHVARAIHYSVDPSPQAPPLVPLSCSALGGETLRSAIQAVARSYPATKEGERGTFLLTDIDEAPLDVQLELAQLLPAGQLGLRWITTARRPLVEVVREGRFRADLAAWLATLSIELPALAERLEDMPLLLQRFVEDQNARDAKQVTGFSIEALDRLAIYPWPGNLAELAEVARLSRLAAEGPEIGWLDVPANVRAVVDAAQHPRRSPTPIDLEQVLASLERELIERALQLARGNKAQAARLLSLTRPRLYRRLLQLGMVSESEVEEPEEEGE